MSTKQLAETITDGGIHLTNFFNGRLLTAEDLLTEQTANRQQHQQLGRAIGEGIITGLQVQQAPGTGVPVSTLTVSAGLALNRQGQVLSLPVDTDVALVPAAQQQAADAGLFATCEPPQSMLIPTGKGVYILVLSPASGFEGRAQMSGLSVQGVIGPACGSKYAVEGVKFGRVQLDVNTLPNISDDTRAALKQLMARSDPASLSMLRNMLAHLCFGTEELYGFVRDPFKKEVDDGSPYINVGALADLRTQGTLTDCDVPLALLYWTADGIKFVDMGSVRRRPVTGPPSQYWPLAVAGGYQAIGEAISLQFQEQLGQLLDPKTPQSQLAAIRAADYFRYLPAGGLVPFSGASGNFAITKGFSPQFFDGTAHRDPVYIEGAKVEHLLRGSLSYQPINLSEQVAFWVYWVRENIQAITEGTANIPQAYLLFLSGHVPYQGNAQFNLAHWDYSNYAITMDL